MDFSLVIVIGALVVAAILIVAYIHFGRSESSFSLDIGGAAPTASGGSDTSSEKTFAGRLKGLFIYVCGIFGVLLARLWSMQLVSSEEYSRQAELNRTRTIRSAAPRGRILDRNGVEIVTNRPSLTVVAGPDVVYDTVEVQLLSNLCGMPYMATRRKIRDESEGAQSKRTVSVDVSRRVVAFIAAHPEVFPDVDVEQRSERFYPFGSLAAHVVGYTGTVTAEQLESNTEETGGITYHSGDIVGQAGVEYQYESVLQGIAGEQTVYVDSGGTVLDYVAKIDAQSGSDLVLTIDAKVQEAAERSLVNVTNYIRAKQGYPASSGCAVAIDCSSGEIICMASFPTYSPSVFVGGISNSDWDTLTNEKNNYPLFNRAISGQYPAGSTIKALSSLAALEYGLATDKTTWNCTGWWTGFGEDYGMYCYLKTGHGMIGLQRGITMSCDVVYYEIGKGFYYSDEPEGLQKTYRKFGLGSYTGIDLPSEECGRVPDAEWKWNYFTDAPDDSRRWQGGDSCNIAIGQGDMLVTCLQMVCAYCGIANDGVVMKPHVLRSVRAATGEGSVIDYKPEPIFECPEPKKSLDLVKAGLKGVVYEESWSQTVHWNSLDKTVIGKTGTGQMAGEYPIGWFVGIVPAENPRYVVGANIDEVLEGAQSGMYVVRDIMGAIYDQPDPLFSYNVENADTTDENFVW